jgi:hypothetical protein
MLIGKVPLTHLIESDDKHLTNTIIIDDSKPQPTSF